jgi:hypothetical protein
VYTLHETRQFQYKTMYFRSTYSTCALYCSKHVLRIHIRSRCFLNFGSRSWHYIISRLTQKSQKNENADFGEKFCENLVIFSRKRRFSRKFSQKYCLLKTLIFAKKFSKNECYFFKNFYENRNFLLKNSGSIFGMQIQILIWNTDQDPYSDPDWHSPKGWIRIRINWMRIRNTACSGCLCCNGKKIFK